MGAYFTVVCRPCRKTLELSKFGRVFYEHAKPVRGEPATVLTMNAILAGLADGEGWPTEYTPALLRWLHEHSAHASPLILNDHEDGIHVVYDDPDGWDETDIDTLCPR